MRGGAERSSFGAVLHFLRSLRQCISRGLFVQGQNVELAFTESTDCFSESILPSEPWSYAKIRSRILVRARFKNSSAWGDAERPG